MNGTTFDTLAYARRLKEAGVAEAQAEAHAEAVRDAITEGAATKTDIADLKVFTQRLGIILTSAGVTVTGLIVGLLQTFG